MYNIDYTGCIYLAIVIVFFGCSMAYFINPLTHRKLLMSKRRIVAVGCVILCLAIGTGAFVGISSGESIKEGDYSDHKCCGYNGSAECDEAPSYRVHAAGREWYYCEAHKEDAYEKYYTFANYTSSKSDDDGKCKSCGRSFKAGDSAGNYMNIARTGMCNNCYRNYKSLESFIGN